MITWTCHICHEERPDDRIDVLTTDLSADFGMPAGTVKQNVRYCNDREMCRIGARTKRLVHDALARKVLADGHRAEVKERA